MKVLVLWIAEIIAITALPFILEIKATGLALL